MQQTAKPSAKTLLIITTSFDPENAIGAVRVTKLTKYLAPFYQKVVVICPSINESTQIDTTLQLECQSNVEIYRIKDFYLFKQIRKIRNIFLSNSKGSDHIESQTKSNNNFFKQIFLEVLFFSFTHLKNFNFYVKASLVFLRLSKKIKFDDMFTSYPSYGSHLAGLLAKKHSPNIFWVADFRDPMIYPSISRSKVFQLIQNKTIKNSQLVTTISNGVKQMLADGLENEKMNVLHNGFDDCPVLPTRPILDIRNINFCYTGSLYMGKRDLSTFFNLLRTFIDENPKFLSLIKVNYAGSDFQSLLKMAAREGLENVLINHGQVSRLASLQIQNESNFIIVATWNTRLEQGILTGKIFEAFMLQKKVIGVVSGDIQDSEFKALIEKEDIGIVFEDNFPCSSDYDQFQSLIIKSLKENESATNKTNNSLKNHRFHYRVLSEDLRDMIQRSQGRK